jgi:hypothetical protein
MTTCFVASPGRRGPSSVRRLQQQQVAQQINQPASATITLLGG